MHASRPFRAADLDPTRAAGLSPREAPPAGALRGSPHSAPYAPLSLRRFVASSRPSFTLIEMVVVVAVVLLLLALIIPAATTLWNERKVSAAENTIQGLLMTTRARAMQTQGIETGFLAFVDAKGVQHLVTIAQALPPGAPIEEQLAWQDIFVIRDEPDHVLPAPMRVVPRYAIFDADVTPDECPVDEEYRCFSSDELGNNNFEAPSAGRWDQKQRHRNFFTMIFSTDGQLLINRDVLIQDPDLVHETAESGASGQVHRGDRTGLRVGPGPPSEGEPTTTTFYFARDEPPDRTPNMPVPLDPNNPDSTFGSLVTDEDDVALNFPSVDGLLVYDDSLFNATPPEEKHQFLRLTARPLYVSRWTGAVVRGPVGESPE